MAGCGSSVPGDSVADVAGNPITTQAFNHWMYVAAKSQAAQNPGQPVIVPNDPPNFNNCIAQVRKQIPSLAEHEDGDAPHRLQAAVHLAVESGDGLPDQGLLVPGRRGQAGRQGHRRRGAEGVHHGQEPAVPDGRRVQHLPQPDRPDAPGCPVPLPGQRDRAEAGRQAQHDGHPGADRDLLQQPPLAVRHAGVAQHADRAGQEPGRRARGQEGAPVGPELGRRWPRSTRPTRPPRTPAACSTGSPSSRRIRRSQRGVLGAGQQAARPGQGPVRLLRVRGDEDHPGHAPVAGPGHRADPPAAHQPGAAERPDRGRQPGQEGLAQPDHLPRRLRDGRLQGLQGAEDGHHRPPPARRPRGERAGASRRPRRRSPASTRSRAGCESNARGTASRTSARSCPTRSRSPTSWPTPPSAATTRRCSTSSATSCSRFTSWRCCSRSGARATSRRSRTTSPTS